MKNKKLKRLLKNKKFIIFMILLLVLIICLFLLKGIFFPGGGSNYGNRLDGIEKISFTKKDQEKINQFINNNEKVTSSKINIHGKIINVIYNVNKDVSLDDAKNIATSSLEKFDDTVKGFYDIQFIITMTDEKGEETQTTDENGKTITTVVKKFPLMGYKNSSKEAIVW
ncbi:MAG: hypothetical protein J6J17_04385 [Bacilli bacterium]|nr:hypothetical protein [Bacilli bacterium]